MKIRRQSPDLICLTETVDTFLGEEGYAIASEPRPMFRGHPARRKVVLWSRHSWKEVDCDGQGLLKDGRFIRGVTDSPIGPVEVIGVCIPWNFSHVSTGRRDCKAWEDHLEYLQGLTSVNNSPQTVPRIVLGDFNQAIPRKRTPLRVYESLLDTFSGLNICTAGVVGDEGKTTIDHLAHSRELKMNNIQVLSRFEGSKRLSDHFGLTIEMALSS